MPEYTHLTKPSDLEGGLIMVANDGQLIRETNYFTLDMADAGLLYMSMNANCFRLLVPDSKLDFVPEMRTGKKIGVAYGMSRRYDKAMVRVLFDDFTQTPFFIDFGDEQIDFIPKTKSKGLRFIAYDSALNILINKPTSFSLSNDITSWFD